MMHDVQSLRALVRQPRQRALRLRDFGDATSTGTDAGATAGAAYASSQFGPEAGPIGAAVGGFVGGKIGGAVSSMFGGGAAPCECQLGACDDSDNLDLTKYNILRSHADPSVAALIDHQVEASMPDVRAKLAAAGAGEAGKALADRIEICAKLTAYAQAAAAHWTLGPSPAVLAFRAADADCRAKGYAGWNGSFCVAVPHVAMPCPGQGRNAAGDNLTYRTPEGACVSCPGGVEWVNRGQANAYFRCKPPPMSPAKKAAVATVAVGVVAGVGWALWTFKPWRLF